MCRRWRCWQLSTSRQSSCSRQQDWGQHSRPQGGSCEGSPPPSWCSPPPPPSAARSTWRGTRSRPGTRTAYLPSWPKSVRPINQVLGPASSSSSLAIPWTRVCCSSVLISARYPPRLSHSAWPGTVSSCLDTWSSCSPPRAWSDRRSPRLGSSSSLTAGRRRSL